MATETEMLERVARALGVGEVTDRLKSTLLRKVITAQGGSCDDLPDNLQSTLLERLAATCGGGGGGVDREQVEADLLCELTEEVDSAVWNRRMHYTNSKLMYAREGAFSGEPLQTVNLPNLMETSRLMFSACVNLTEVNIKNARTIANGSFIGCTSLQKIVLETAVVIGSDAFQRCESLSHVDLECTNAIDAYAFYYCNNLTTLILRTTETVCALDVTAILGTKIMTEEGMPTGEGFIYIPTSMDAAYRAAYEPVFEELGAAGLYDILFRKIEDYSEICG